MNKEQRMEIANTIWQQMGGGRLAMMTGAKNVLALENGLSFQLPRTPGYTRDGINYVKVTLNSMDLYDVEFGRIRGLDYTIKTIAEGIYCDGLIPLFEETTGLRTSL